MQQSFLGNAGVRKPHTTASTINILWGRVVCVLLEILESWPARARHRDGGKLSLSTPLSDLPLTAVG